jgi:hypothetical protein
MVAKNINVKLGKKIAYNVLEHLLVIFHAIMKNAWYNGQAKYVSLIM